MQSRTVSSALAQIWHVLPWNLLYWLVVAALLGAAVTFGTIVEVRDARLRHTDEFADIRNGDSVRVAVVLNGDEVVIEKGKARATVRMLGIRSFDPVVNEFEITAFGRASLSFLNSWALDQKVRLLFDKTIKDTRGRYLAYVERDGIDLNQRMVEEGLAMVYTEYQVAREATYLTAEIMARKAGRGIWGGTRTRARIKALRRDWDATRHERDGMGVADPLFEESR